MGKRIERSIERNGILRGGEVGRYRSKEVGEDGFEVGDKKVKFLFLCRPCMQ
jgi:hypothetical protein